MKLWFRQDYRAIFRMGNRAGAEGKRKKDTEMVSFFLFVGVDGQVSNLFVRDLHHLQHLLELIDIREKEST